jgi:hypothetical protein
VRRSGHRAKQQNGTIGIHGRRKKQQRKQQIRSMPETSRIMKGAYVEVSIEPDN